MVDAERVILGAAQLGFNYGIANQLGQPSLDEARLIFNSAAAKGIKKVDTAVAYGSSQEVIGKTHDDRFELMSKWGEHPADLSMTLELLKAEKLNVWMAHRSEAIIKNPQLWQRMRDQKEVGLVHSIGVSVYGISEVQALLDMDIVPDVIQLPVNIFSSIEAESISKFNELGITIHARSIFLQGLLLCNPLSLDSFFDPVKPWLLAFAECFPTSPSRVQALIQAVLNQAAVDSVVLGAESALQIDDWFDSTNSINEELPALPELLPERILNPTMWPR